jgi:O-antigen/teichoic acid export membrane protein
MRSRVLRRRSATVLGVYVATALGFLTTVVATRELGTGDYARFAAIVAATAFLQLLLDLTVEEALVKYGFRYTEAQRWGRLRRIFEIALAYKLVGGIVAGIALAALAPLIGSIWNVDDVLVPMLVAAAIPVLQAPEGVAGGAVILRGRYDVRGALLAVSMGLRLAGVGIGAMYGLTEAVLGMVIGQAIATVAISIVGLAAFRRFPQARSEPLGEDRPAVRRFVLSSTIASSLVSARGTLGTALMPVVAPIDQAGYFRNAQAPATGFAALSSPARLVLLTEQTRDFEAGRYDQMYAMLRRYIVGTTSLMVVAVPVLWVLMPFLMGVLYGPAFREHATMAARLVLIAAAMQLIWGWSKSFPVSIGRPGLRIVVQSVEIAVFVPLLLWFGSKWGATGGAAAMVVSTAVFCLLWAVLLARLRHERAVPEAVAS